MRRHGERLRTPKECREKRFILSQCFVLCTCLTITCSQVKRTKYKGQSTKFNLWRIKQTRPLLAALESKMLIGELGCHPAPRRAIEKTDLNQVRLDDFFDGILLFLNRRRQRANTHRPA